MRNLVLVLVFFIATFCTFAGGKDIQQITVQTKIYCEHCIECGSCGANINNHIRENKGIKKVKINSKANSITVFFDAGKTSPDKIKASINKAGFEADGVLPSSEAMAKLDGCCRKK